MGVTVAVTPRASHAMSRPVEPRAQRRAKDTTQGTNETVQTAPNPKYKDPTTYRRQGQSHKQKSNLVKARAAQAQTRLPDASSSTTIAPESPTKPLRCQITLLKAENTSLRAKNVQLEKSVKTEKQGRRRAKKTIGILKSLRVSAASELRACKNDLVGVRLSLVHVQNQTKALETRLAGAEGQLAKTRVRLEKEIKRSRALEKRNGRAQGVLERAITRTRNEMLRKASHFSIFRRGAYTTQARAMARLLMTSGTAQSKVGGVIQAVGRLMGKKVNRCMSAGTAGRARLEGGLAAQMQTCDEMLDATDLTFSSDGTGHKHIEYVSRAISLKVDGKRKIRTTGIQSVPDKSSETQFHALKQVLDDFGAVWNASPIAKRANLLFHKEIFAEKLRGTSGDHAKDQKKQHFDFLAAWKESVRNSNLGWERMKKLPFAELTAVIASVKENLIDKRGGVTEYMRMSMEDVRAMDLEVLEAVVIRLGGEEYAALPAEERRKLSLFVWGGCCMHKDLNTMKGGDKTMQAYWDSKDPVRTPPITLANKTNAAILAAVPEGEEMTEIEAHAAQSSHRGGAHAALLGGLITANSNDSQGQHNTWDYYLGAKIAPAKPRKYPGVSFTRFQSTADAAEYIIEFRDVLVEFMDVVRHKKEKSGLTNIEQNFEKALSDIPTITEWVVHGLISQCFSHPYMRYVRGPGLLNVNHLDLGPLHEKLIAFVEKVIADPDLLLDDPTGEKSTFDGSKFDNPLFIEKAKILIPALPDVRGALLAFLDGYLVTWRRFANEFAKGGIIDGLTVEEREAAWLAATNDINEGALGWMKVYLRRRPRMSQHMMNAQFMYERNETETWMEKRLVEQDHKYLRKAARSVQASKPEAKRRRELVEADEAKVAAKKQKIADDAKKDQEELDKLYRVELVLKHDEVLRLNVKQSKEQLAVWRKWDSEVPAVGKLNGSYAPGQKERQDALWAAIQRAGGKDIRPARES